MCRKIISSLLVSCVICSIGYTAPFQQQKNNNELPIPSKNPGASFDNPALSHIRQNQTLITPEGNRVVLDADHRMVSFEGKIPDLGIQHIQIERTLAGYAVKSDTMAGPLDVEMRNLPGGLTSIAGTLNGKKLSLIGSQYGDSVMITDTSTGTNHLLPKALLAIAIEVGSVDAAIVLAFVAIIVYISQQLPSA
jgi:hypothetical protein